MDLSKCAQQSFHSLCFFFQTREDEDSRPWFPAMTSNVSDDAESQNSATLFSGICQPVSDSAGQEKSGTR